VSDRPVPAPVELGGVRNFAWVEPELVARGEQPPLRAETFAQLRAAGIRTVLSLRPDGEPPPRVTYASWPEYHLAEERALAEEVGLRFVNVPLTDYVAPAPAELATALRALDDAVRTTPAVYVHCRAGAGRTALVSGAWSIAHGRPSNEVLRVFQFFMRYVAESRGLPRAEWAAMYRRVGQPQILWALQHIAAALGDPITVDAEDLLAPEPPPAADGWPAEYGERLRAWRPARSG
jgi:protein-tyrosine phosphatase